MGQRFITRATPRISKTWKRSARVTRSTSRCSTPAATSDRNPAGFVVIIKDGPTIYHSGDTAYFKDMETIGESYAIDVALLNTGGHFGMEPKMAARAAKAVGAKLAIPQHFGTFAGIAPNADVFAAELKRLKIDFHEMKPGDTIVFRQGPRRQWIF